MTTPTPDTYENLPRFVIADNINPLPQYRTTDDPQKAASLAREMAEQNPGVFIAIYERKLLMREQVKDDEAAPPA